MNSNNSDTFIARRPLLWLAAALLFTVPPMFDALPAWVPGFFLIALLVKFWMEKRGARLRSIFLKTLGCALGICGIVLTYHTLKGLEPGISALLVLAAFKILEAHTARDFHILVMLGWFLCLCGFFISQNLATALEVLTAFALLLTATIQFHRGSHSRGAFWPPLRTAFKLLVQALPLALIMFFFFPRGSGAWRFYSQQAAAPQTQAATGLPERLTPGNISSVTASFETAFRAEFPDGNIPPRGALYWRGAVLWRGYGMNWEPGPPAYNLRPQNGSGASLRQRIVIEPNPGRWMFALDWPARAPSGAQMMPGNFLRSERPLSGTRRYEVISFQELRAPELSPEERDACTHMPQGIISDAVSELVNAWTSQRNEPRTIVQSALRFFKTQGFVYSLSPGEYKDDALDDFLFRRKIGFCEHYAASFATLMRVAGIPSRVVVGYQGGQFNDFGGYIVVRQADAHAWCEVWLPGTGWMRVDPTSVVEPERVNLGFDAFVEKSTDAQNPSAARDNTAAASVPRRLLNQARLAWDTLNYAWDARVLSFDAESQQELLDQAGIGDSSPEALVVWLFVGAAAILGAYALWMSLRTREKRDPVKTLYERFCDRAAHAGASREAWEGPADFAKRGARLLPDEAERIRRLTSLYIALRYAPEPSATLLKNFAAEVKAFTPRGADTERKSSTQQLSSK